MIQYLAIFDVDGTLIDFGHCINFDALLVQTFESIQGINVPSQAERDKLWRAGKDHEILLNGWGVPDAREFWTIFDRLDFEARSTAIAEGKIIPYPDALPVLSMLQASGQVALAVHTNTPARLSLYQLEHFNMKKYFDYVLALDMAGYDQSRAKPEPWGVYFLQNLVGKMHRMDFKGKTIFVGDSDDIDMLTAKNSHIPGILVSREEPGIPALHAFDLVNSLEMITLSLIKSILRRFHKFC